MNVRELIEALTESADDLSLGMDAEVRVLLCAGHGRFAILTKAVSVDSSNGAVMVAGHPHLDDGPTVRRPMTLDADAELARLVADPTAEPTVVPAYVLVQIGGEMAYRLPMRSTGKALAPGELDALRVGCLCDPGRNEEARRMASGDGNVALVIHKDCPVHQTITAPEP